MKILIKQQSDHHYLAEGNTWTTEKSLARVFADSIAALDYCLAQKLQGVDIVLGFEDEDYDFKLNRFART